MNEKDQYKELEQEGAWRDAEGASDQVVFQAYAYSAAHLINSGVLLNFGTPHSTPVLGMQDLIDLPSVVDPLQLSSCATDAFTPALQPIYGSMIPTISYANYHPSSNSEEAAIKASSIYPQTSMGSAISAGLMTAPYGSAVDMVTHAGALRTCARDRYGFASLMGMPKMSVAASNYLSVGSMSSANCANNWAVGGSRSLVDHIYSNSAAPKSSCAVSLGAISLAAAGIHCYSHLGISNMAHRGTISTVTPYAISGMSAVSNGLNHKYYGGGMAVEHFLPGRPIHNKADNVYAAPRINSKRTWYGGGNALVLRDDDIVRSIGSDYDHYVVNQKRDTYRHILDNYTLRNDLGKGDLYAIRPGVSWPEAVVSRLSTFVDSLDLYIATKDASLLCGISSLEWEAMAFSYSAGYSKALEDFYERVNSHKARYIYAFRRYNAIVQEKCIKKFKLDLRIVFRNIIRFLFKNMDDESGELNVEGLKGNNIFSPVNTNPNVRFRYISSVKHAA